MLVGHCATWAVLYGLSLEERTTADAVVSAAPFALPLGLFPPVAMLLFFGLSGYLIGRPFLAAVLGRRSLPRIGRYLQNRALRIFPALILATAVAVLVGLGLGVEATSLQLLAVVTGFQVYAQSSFSETLLPQAWSVDVELLFYAALPLLAVIGLVALRRMRIVLAAGVVLGFLAAAFLGSIWLRSLGGEGSLQFSPPWTAFLFVPGLAVAVADILVTPWLEQPANAARVRRLPLVLGLVGFTAIFLYGFQEPQTGWVFHYVVGKWAVLSGIACTCWLAALLLRQRLSGTCPNWLDNGPFRWFGERSYSLYLLHGMVILLLLELIPAGLGAWELLGLLSIATLVVSSVLAALSFRFVEAPFLRRKHGSFRASR